VGRCLFPANKTTYCGGFVHLWIDKLRPGAKKSLKQGDSVLVLGDFFDRGCYDGLIRVSGTNA
jgi:hypothetical protein